MHMLYHTVKFSLETVMKEYEKSFAYIVSEMMVPF